ncbi:restriction endonuclease subunit S [Roseateles sp.]|uniref:restriction endonuclease subunit S n=1 Tax=Roseateles sp. TaxID=1971397 RepID=UPI003BA713DA
MSAVPVVELGGVTTKVGSGATPRGGEAAYKPSGIPLIRSMNVHFDGFRRDGLAFLDEEQARALKNVEVRAGDVLLNITGASIGRVTVAPTAMDGARVNQHVCIIRPDQHLDSSFLRWYLAAPSQQRLINGIESGATRQALTKEKILGFEVPLFPLSRQREIVAEIEKQFSRLDDAVANLKRVKANLKRYKAAVLDAAVKGRIGPDDAEGDDGMPRDWHWSTVGELAVVGTGATPARSNDAFYRGGTIPWVTSSAVNEPFIDTADQFVTDEALRNTNLTLYPPGTLLVAMYGEGKTRGKCSELRIAATTNQALAALQVDSAVRPWLKLFFEHNYNNTRRIASGGVQPNLNLGLLRSIRLPRPPVNKQHRIVAEVDRRLSIVREVEAEVDANLKRAQALRQAVLTRAFRG